MEYQCRECGTYADMNRYYDCWKCGGEMMPLKYNIPMQLTGFLRAPIRVGDASGTTYGLRQQDIKSIITVES